MQYFPENKISGFTTKLPREIVLPGEWECGVTEVRYPLTFFNVAETMSVTKIYDPPPLTQTLQFLPGCYTTPEVVGQINAFIKPGFGACKVNRNTGKTTLTAGRKALRMTRGLLTFLGEEFEPKPESGLFERSTTYKGLRAVGPRHGFDTLFIYCDVLAPRIVGDSNSSLLVTLPNGGKRLHFGDAVNTRFANIRYYPVAKHRFHTIRIDVRTDVGLPAKFEGGKVFVEIHFRKVINA